MASGRIDSWLDPVKMRLLPSPDKSQKKIESTGGIICDYCLHLAILITSVLSKPRKDTGYRIFMLTLSVPMTNEARKNETSASP